MSCPTCDHTMQSIVPKVFWCPRCGTVKEEFLKQARTRDENNCFVPKLVDRCLEFSERLRDEPEHFLWKKWNQTGIQESITKE